MKRLSVGATEAHTARRQLAWPQKQQVAFNNKVVWHIAALSDDEGHNKIIIILMKTERNVIFSFFYPLPVA